MSAEVETLFYVREKPWHGLGTRVEAALSSKEALIAAGLNWEVIQKKLYTKEGDCVPGFYANVRDNDNKVLGVVTNRYKIVQNREAFAFTDELLGKGVKYETAGSLKGQENMDSCKASESIPPGRGQSNAVSGIQQQP